MKARIWLTSILAVNVVMAGVSGRQPAPFKPDWLDDPLYRACDSLVSWWPADGHHFDLAGAYHGERSGPVGFDKGCRGAAFSFPQEQGTVTVGQPAGLTDTFTLAVWVYATAPRLPTPPHVDRYAGTQGQRYAVYPTHGGTDGRRAGCGISVGTNGVGVFEHTHDNLPCVLVHDTPIKDWTHLAVVYEKGQPTLYVNGTAVKTGVRSPWTVFPGHSFGDPGAPTNSYGPYRGRTDEPMLFGRALDEGEIKAILRAAQPDKVPGAGRKPLPLSDAAFAELWSYLSGERAPRVLFAVQRLAASGDDAVRRLRTSLMTRVDAGGLKVEELIRRLDDDRFRERERAMQLLLQTGESVVPKLQAKLKDNPSAEARERIELLLRRLPKASSSPEQMRAVRAVTALAWIDTSASRKLLAELAEGPEETPKTIAARAALQQHK
ncbi:MAG TPA: LamG-like jellyroll fold domain-containing protein [Gemmataceae bacterium]|nr:LamG-like jellyroll fold domain-containing protein [Gemmataceae bacterium]